MEEYSLTQIIVIVFGGSGIATFLISLSVYLSGRWDKRRERRIEEFNEKVQNATDIKKLELEHRSINSQTVIEQLWAMLGEEKKNLALLTEEVKRLQKQERLNQKMVLAINRSISRVRSQLALIENLIEQRHPKDGILSAIETVRRQLDDLENLLM